jgi:hypothetical protein
MAGIKQLSVKVKHKPTLCQDEELLDAYRCILGPFFRDTRHLTPEEIQRRRQTVIDVLAKSDEEP